MIKNVLLYLIDAQSRLLSGIEQFEKDQKRKISRTSTLSSSEKSMKDPVLVWLKNSKKKNNLGLTYDMWLWEETEMHSYLMPFYTPNWI